MKLMVEAIVFILIMTVGMVCTAPYVKEGIRTYETGSSHWLTAPPVESGMSSVPVEVQMPATPTWERHTKDLDSYQPPMRATPPFLPDGSGRDAGVRLRM